MVGTIILKQLLEMSGYVVAAFLLIIGSQLKTWFSNKKFFNATRMINRNSFIRELMVELRAKLNADRVKLFQFHNGEYFVSGESIMKSTMTHVASAIGVSYPESANTSYSSVPTSYLTRVLSEMNDNGYIIIKTMDMDDDHYLKHIFVSHNVKVAFMTPVTDPKNNWIGFLMCVWMYNEKPKIDLIESDLYATKIGNALSKK